MKVDKNLKIANFIFFLADVPRSVRKKLVLWTYVPYFIY